MLCVLGLYTQDTVGPRVQGLHHELGCITLPSAPALREGGREGKKEEGQERGNERMRQGG